MSDSDIMQNPYRCPVPPLDCFGIGGAILRLTRQREIVSFPIGPRTLPSDPNEVTGRLNTRLNRAYDLFLQTAPDKSYASVDEDGLLPFGR
jgi:hypothetical protein